MKGQREIRVGVSHSLAGTTENAKRHPVDVMHLVVQSICILILLIIPVRFSTPLHAASPEEKEIKNVLVVNSYHSGYEWSDDIVKGIQSVLGDNNFDVSIEYLDSKRYSDAIYYKYLEEIIRYKYGDAKIDAMIVSDHHAYNLMLEMRQTFQSDTPLVFCGIDKVDSEGVADYKPIYGIVEGDSGIRSTLDLILSIHPGIRKIFFIADGTTSAGVMLSYVRDYEPLYKEIVTFDYLINMSADELKAALKNVPQNSVVMWLHFIKDKNGRVFSVTESQTYAANNASVPVYVCYGFSADTGIVGGSIIRGFTQGEKAAQIALELLSKNIVPARFYQQSPFTNMFDYKVMKRFNIGIKDIPENSVIYNKPFSAYEKYRWQIIGIIIFIVFQTIIISMLMINLKKRKAGEKSLSESEARFRATFEQAAVGIAHVSTDGRFLRINKKFCDIVGYTSDEITTKTFQEITYPEDLESDTKQTSKLLSGEIDTYSMDKRYICKDESLVWINLTVSLVRDIKGQPQWFVSAIKDITERKQAEDKLKQLRGYTDHLIQTANVMIVSLDTDGRVIHFNPAAEAITGYSLSELAGKDWFELIVPYDRYPKVYEEFDRLIQGGLPRFFENPIVTKDGLERFISWTNSEIRRGEKIIGVTSFGIDITERNKAEKLLRESEEKFRLLVEQSPLSIQILNTDGRVDQVNEAFKKLWAFPEEALPEVLEKYNILEDEEAARRGVIPAIRRAFSGEVVNLPVIEYDATNTMVDLGLADTQANKIWLQSSFYPVKNSKGEVVNVVNIEEDMTERKQVEQNIQEYQQKLKGLASQLTIAEEKERRRVATDLHDHVGQSLAFARIQLAAARKSNSLEKRNAILDDTSETLLHTIQDIKHLIFELSAPSMNELGLGAAISEWLEEQIEKRHGLKTELIDDGQRKPLDDDTRAILFRNVRELLANVVKHANANKVSVEVGTIGEDLRVIVQDDGVGFDLLAATQKGKRTGGFGLFSIQERMADLAGSLEIVSEPGKGCKAILMVPLSEGQG